MEAVENKGMYEDYGYVASFAGPGGGRVLIVAGTRDAAVAQVAETLTNRADLDALARTSGGAAAFEALYKIDGLDSLNVDGKLLVASSRQAFALWGPAARRQTHFPAG